jgi:hypothetical protein
MYLSALESPDILVRQQPDIDISSVALADQWTSQDAYYGEPNYVYVRVNNRGDQPAYDTTACFFWRSVDEDRWDDQDFSPERGDSAPGSLPNMLRIPYIPAHGSAIAGPLRWMPQIRQQYVDLAVRVVNQDDVSSSADQYDLANTVTSNNVTERHLRVVLAPGSDCPDTLVVPLSFNDVPWSAEASSLLTSRLARLPQWLDEVSGGAASIRVKNCMPIPLRKNAADYAKFSSYRYCSELCIIALAKDALEQVCMLEQAYKIDPAVFSRPAEGSKIRHVLFVTNEDVPVDGWVNKGFYTENAIEDRATPGPVSLMIGGKTYLVSLSVHSVKAPIERMEHGLLHHFGFPDVSADGVRSSTAPVLSPWSILSRPFSGGNPLAWTKEMRG